MRGRRARLFGIFLAAASVWLVGWRAPAAQENLILCVSPGVIDGDTFRCDRSLKVRLWGIDAPERYAEGGPAATRALAELTRGRTLVCKRRGTSYDRIVAQCFIGDQDLAAELVRRGAAADAPRFSKGRYAH